MIKPQQFDENLSSEILDENASVSNLNLSPNISKNMASSPFKSSSPLLKTSKCLSCPLQKSFLPTSSTEEKPLSGSKSSLKSDIRSLLHKAIRLRSFSEAEAKPCRQPSAERDEAKSFNGEAEPLMTIGDIQSPNCFE